MLAEITNQKPRILVADDEKFNLILLSRILDSDYEVDMVVNGQEVLDSLAVNDYDAVLLDIMMPVMGGLICLEKIREMVNFASLPVILVSALSDKESIVRGIEFGANDYISKPLDAKVVKARLNTQVALKRLMDERNAAIASLQQANDMKAHMMQIASHDLKNPLHNLGMTMSLLSGVANDDIEKELLLGIAKDNINTMMNIINEFLTGQDNTDGISATLEELAVTDLIVATIKQNEIAAQHKNIEIITDYQADVLILADERRLSQVMNNIISNAIKYSPKNSHVTIRTSHNKETWRLEVQDSGTGIPESERQYLFQAFSKNQISTEPTDGESSTGLGLWIASEMMRVQNGTIGMDSPASGGCCFWIELPHTKEATSIGA